MIDFHMIFSNESFALDFTGKLTSTHTVTPVFQNPTVFMGTYIRLYYMNFIRLK
jgi:hypothetical protein